MTTYITEAHEKRIRGQIISVVNLTPSFREDQKSAVKRAIDSSFMKFSVNMCRVKLEKTEPCPYN